MIRIIIINNKKLHKEVRMKRVNKYLSIFLSTVMIGLSINPVNTHVFAETDEGISSEIVSAKDNDNTESIKDLKDKNLSADSSEENKAEVPSEDGVGVKPEASEFSTLNLLKDGVGANAWLETDFTYFEDHHLEENAVCITGLSVLGKEKQKNNHDLVLPDEIKGKKVLAIAKKAFLDRKMDSKTQFISVKLPQSLKVVGDSAFAGNLLTAIEFPDTLMKIEVNAFAFNQLKEVLIPESVQAIEIHAFYNNKILQGNAKIDNEKGKVKVDFEAFADNGEDGTTEVTPVYLKSEENLNWTAEDFEFYYDPILGTDEDGTGFPDVNYTVKGFSEKGKEKLKKNKNVVLPSADTKGIVPVWVLEDSFKGEKIESVEIPKNYTHVQFRAFKDCGLKKVVFHDGLIDVNDNAFENNELTEVKFPSTFRYPSKAAFKGNQLTEIKLPESCQSIGPESFMNNQLVKVEMGSKVVHIYERAFANNQLTEVNIPKSLKNQTNGVDGIKKDAFDGNPGKTNPLNPSEKKVLLWTPNKDNPNNLISRGNYVVDPVAENNEYQPSDFTYNKENEVEGFSKKGSKKFNKMKDKPVILPAKTDKGAPVVGIADYAFQEDAMDIKAIVMPEGYRVIEDGAFQYSAIEEIDAPSTLEEIGEYSFLQSENVVKIHTTKTVAKRIKNTSNYWEIIADKEEPSVPQPNSKWETEDFVFGTFKVIELEDDGSQKEVELNAVSGFSQKGLEKLKTVKDLQLPTVDAKGNKVEAVTKGAFSAKLGDKRLNSLQIPEGYRAIGSMAFAFNGCKGELVLPDSIEFVDMAAFFRNEFTSLTVPAKMTDIPLSMMRGNKLSSVIFKGNVETIGRLAFSENRIEEITVPDSLKSIGEQAFTTNTGSDKYDGKVIIRTASGANPNNLQDKENYLVDPKNQGTNPSINYKEWETDDFRYEGTTVTGFSKQGNLKIKKNKNLVIPDKTPDGKPVTVIGMDAFRNLNQGYDIESVKLPDTIVEIEDYALQFNDIQSITLPRDLKKLGMGVFMMSNVNEVKWNKNLEYIDQVCFYNCELGKIELPSSVETIMNAAFRKCSLTEVTFAKDSKLKTIQSLAFADNKLSTIVLPNKLEVIGSQAFGDNKFTELNVPGTLKEIGFQAFVNNPGIKEYDDAVVIHTPGEKNPNALVDDVGKTFIVDPKVKATEADKQELKSAIDAAEEIDSKKLTEEYKKFFEDTLKDAKSAYTDKNASKSNVRSVTKALLWANKRAELNRLMFEKESLDAKSSTFDQEKWKAVEKAYESAKKNLMVINITDTKVEQLIHNLSVALKSLETDPLEGATAYEGEANVPKSHYITPYTIKVKVWVKDGKIVYVRDNGTVCDDPNEEEKPNEGYYNRAVPIMHQYIGKTVEEVMGNSLGKDLGIDVVSKATVSCNVIHQAVQNALKKISSGEKVMISFAKGDGSGIMEDVYVEKGTSYKLPECGFTAPEGEQFRCWQVNGKDKLPGDEIVVKSPTVVTALWEEKELSLEDIRAVAIQSVQQLKNLSQPRKNYYIGSIKVAKDKPKIAQYVAKAKLEDSLVQPKSEAKAELEKIKNKLTLEEAFGYEQAIESANTVENVKEITKELKEKSSKFIDDFNIVIVEPKAEENLATEATCDNEHVVIKNMQWFDGFKKVSGKAGFHKSYKVKVEVELKDGYLLSANGKFMINNKKGNRNGFVISHTFDATDMKKIQNVELSFAGLKLGESFPMQAIAKAEGIKRQEANINWSIGNVIVPKDKKVEPDREYTATISLFADKDYQFAEDANVKLNSMLQNVKEIKVKVGDFDPTLSDKKCFDISITFKALNAEPSLEPNQDEVKAAKQQLQKYVDSVKPDVLKLEGIATDGNKTAIEKFNAHLERAKALLVKEDSNITKAELEEMQKMPSYKKDGKKIKGSFSKIVKDMRADFKVLGERSKKNKHNGQMYPVLKSGEIKIESKIAGLKKEGDKRLYLNYVTKEEYGKNFDVIGSATPKYDKKTVPAESYTVTEDNGIYTIQLKNIPEDAVIIKPVIKVQLAEMTFVENGDLVYLKEQTSNEGNSSSGKDKKDKKDKKEDQNKKKEQEEESDNIVDSAEKQTKKHITVVCDLNKDTIITTIDGKKVVKKADVPPYLKDNRLMLSVRFLAEELGYQVKWDNKTKTVTLQDGNTVCTLKVGSNEMIINGEVVHLDTQPEVKKGRVMVPVSSVVKAFRLKQGTSERSIVWDAKEKKITISVMK